MFVFFWPFEGQKCLLQIYELSIECFGMSSLGIMREGTITAFKEHRTEEAVIVVVGISTVPVDGVSVSGKAPIANGNSRD